MIGISVWQLQIPGCASLKEKRSVVKSLKQRLHNEFNISVAETAHHDILQRSEISACVMAVDQPQANRVLASADQLVVRESRARIVDSYTTYY